MEITTLSSSSSGNCVLVSVGGRHILIDAGISCRRLGVYLAAVGLTLSDISEIYITHTHSDHVAGLMTTSKKYAIKIHCSADAHRYLKPYFHESREATPLTPETVYETDSYAVTAFATSHDSPGSVGYRVTDGKHTFVYCTDLGVVTPAAERGALGADIIVLESNHDVTMLKNGPYPPALKRRILSAQGHLSNASCSRFAIKLADAGARHIILSHISHENNTPSLAFRENVGALKKHNVKIDDNGVGSVTVSCAPQFDMGGTVIIK